MNAIYRVVKRRGVATLAAWLCVGVASAIGADSPPSRKPATPAPPVPVVKPVEAKKIETPEPHEKARKVGKADNARNSSVPPIVSSPSAVSPFDAVQPASPQEGAGQ